MTPVRCALFGATMIMGAGVFHGSAMAADDGYQDVVSSVLTAVGVLKADTSPEIDYRERAPLVLPPKMSLEKPVQAGANRSAAWPQDPDVAKRRREAEEARAPTENILGNRRDVLSKDDLVKNRTASATPQIAADHDRCGNQGNKRGCLVLDPDTLRAEGDHYAASGMGDKDKKDIVAGQEPDRMYLTQPPKGYLKTSKTVKATVEAPKPVIDEANPSSALVYREKPDE